MNSDYIRPTKTTAAQNKDALSYCKVRGLYFLAFVFVRSIIRIAGPKHFAHINDAPDTQWVNPRRTKGTQYTLRVWCVIILIMRAKCFGPAWVKNA